MASKSKEQLIQEAQALNLDVDGGSTNAEIQAQIDAAKAGGDSVQPLESSDNAPEEQKVPVLEGERCWNCYAQDRKTRNKLDQDGNCSVCGFQKGELYNGKIEADKAEARQAAINSAQEGF